MTRINFHLWWARLLDILTPEKPSKEELLYVGWVFLVGSILSLVFIFGGLVMLALSGGATW